MAPINYNYNNIVMLCSQKVWQGFNLGRVIDVQMVRPCIKV